jgi:hypothetical protein
VFARAIPNGSKGVTPLGGQMQPTAGEGAILKYKYVQIRPKKTIISDAINSENPNIKLLCTALVCFPKNVASLIRSEIQFLTETIQIIAHRYSNCQI